MRLIKWEDDTTIIPWDSAHFGVFDKLYNVIPLEDQRMYQEDYLGLKELDQTDWLSLITIEGGHMDFNHETLEELVIPLLID